jgi:hypothetical protein
VKRSEGGEEKVRESTGEEAGDGGRTPGRREQETRRGGGEEGEGEAEADAGGREKAQE